MISPDLVSCLMITQAARWRDGMPAGLAAYFDQSYEERELVIVTADPCDEMFEAIGGESGARGLICVEPRGSTLGQLRQAAVEQSSGSIVATWDDDDLSHPDRLAEQVATLQALPLSEACVLLRVTVMDLIAGREFTSARHFWEMTMVAARDQMPAYPPERHEGEDTSVLTRFRQLAVLDRPDLFVHVVHEGATVAKRLASEWWEARSRPEWSVPNGGQRSRGWLQGGGWRALPLPTCPQCLSDVNVERCVRVPGFRCGHCNAIFRPAMPWGSR